MKYSSISVITPSFNQGRFIERTIESVLSQGVPGIEYIVCDGGSTDGTVEILNRYTGRLRWLSEKDNGQADAVNKGIRLTGGHIIGWLNSDDIYYPGALKKVLDFFEAHPDVEISYGDADHIDEDDNVIEPYYNEPWNFERFKDVCYICQPAVFFRRTIVDTFGVLDTSLHYCMDYEYWLRVGAKLPFYYLKEKLAGSRMYKANKSLRDRVKVHGEINDMCRKRLGRVPSRWIFNYAHYVTDERTKYDRTKPEEMKRYLRWLIFYSATSFLRWNRRISRKEINTMRQWLNINAIRY